MSKSNGRGILLDIGLTDGKQKNFTRMAGRTGPDVDIVHDLEAFPWPLKSNSCLIILAAHIVEHVKPWLVVPWMNELWRVMKPNGQLALSTPYAGSPMWYQDPAHASHFNEITFLYFDPQFPQLYKVHQPKPWHIEKGNPTWRTDGNIECVMRAIK